jgi:hypothetical protein
VSRNSVENLTLRAVVVVEHSAEPGTAPDQCSVRCTHRFWPDQTIPQSLMIALLVVVSHVFTDRTTQRRLPQAFMKLRRPAERSASSTGGVRKL